jgi:hypothetical protein
MNRKLLIGVVAALVLSFAYLTAGRILVVKATLSPNATRGQIAHALFHPSYQMAAPHLRVVKSLRNFVTPAVTHACGGGTPPCNGFQSKAACVEACGFCGHCPDCVNGPCTVYKCTHVNNPKIGCGVGWGTKPCTSCELDRQNNCTPP